MKNVGILEVLVVFGVLYECYSKSSSSSKCRCGKTFEDDSGPRIVGGGYMKNEKSHPSLVYIQNNEYEAICGGSIISDRYVLTAGHCVLDTLNTDLQLVVGIHDVIKRHGHAKTYLVEKIIKHHDFKETIEKIPLSDIALLKTNKAIQFNDYIQPVCLPFGLNVDKFKAALATGWGVTKLGGLGSRFPRGTFLSLITNKQCSTTIWNGVFSPIPFHLMLCAYKQGADTCQGDSGGPLLVKDDKDTFYQVGITSFGLECALISKPAMYTRVKTFLPWIKGIVGKFCLPT